MAVKGKAQNGAPVGTIIPADVQLAIRDEIEKEFTRQLAGIKDWTALGFKIIGVGILVLTATFTVFGLTTWKDIKRDAGEEVRRQAETLITKTDSEISVKQTLNDLVNRTVVASELVWQASHPDHRRDLPPANWEKLSNWLRVEALLRDDFEATLQVLDLQSPERKQHDANAFLAEMLSASNQSQYSWMRKQPDKRLAIMSNFHQIDLGNAAARLAESDDSETLRKAAVIYLREINYAEGSPTAEEVIRNTLAGPLQNEAYVTTAALNPATPGFIHDAESLMSITSVTDQTETAVAMLGAMWPPTSASAPVPPFATERAKLSGELIDYILSNDGFIAFTRQHDPILEPRWNFSDISWTLKHGAISTRIPMSPQAFTAMRIYWFLLKQYAQANNFLKLERLLPIFEKPSCCYVVLSSPDPGQVLRVKDSNGQFTDLTLGRSTTRVVSADSNGLHLEWHEGRSGEDWKSGNVSDLRGKDLYFSLYVQDEHDFSR